MRCWRNPTRRATRRLATSAGETVDRRTWEADAKRVFADTASGWLRHRAAVKLEAIDVV